MGVKVLGRRVVLKAGEDPLHALELPGDYCGPVMGYSSDKPAVFFLPPIDEPDKFKNLHHVCSPPHRFVEEADGSLSIFESIGCGPQNAYYYHGYLRAGVWDSA